MFGNEKKEANGFDDLGEFSDFNIDMDDIKKKSASKLAICLCLDISYSMEGESIRLLNEGVKNFVLTLSELDSTKYAIDLAVVTFESVSKREVEFDSIENIFIPEFKADGGTAMGEGVNLALDMVEDRVKFYKEQGMSYKQPWTVIMSDGYSGDDTTTASKRCTDKVKNKKLTVFPFGIGDDYDKDQMKSFSNKKFMIDIKNPSAIKEAFEFLSASAEQASQSMPGESIDVISNLEDKKGLKIDI